MITLSSQPSLETNTLKPWHGPKVWKWKQMLQEQIWKQKKPKSGRDIKEHVPAQSQKDIGQ